MRDKNLTRRSGRAGRRMLAAFALSALAAAAQAQVSVVNMIPNSRSNETAQDSEPNLAVNPANPLQMAGSAFTPNPAGSGASTAPIFVSTDGGATWSLNNIVPGGFKTADITLRFGGTSNILYAGILRQDNFHLNLLRTTDFTQSNTMAILLDRDNEDQPYVQATTVLGGSGVGLDRLYVGNNDFNIANKTAVLDFSLDAAAANPPLALNQLEHRTTSGQDEPQIRPIFHYDGTVYAAFVRWTNFVPDPQDPMNKGTATADVIVVRDDAWGSGATPFSALVDSGDNKIGRKVATGLTVPWDNNPVLGQERLGGSLSIAVDPRQSSRIYLVFADSQAGTYTLHLRRSDDRGVTWTADLMTVANGVNPALAVNIHGKVGLAYQQLTGSGNQQRWETHFRRSTTLGVSFDDTTLARPLASSPSAVSLPYNGDYLHLQAVGKDFYGVFSASNKPDPANFPQSVIYLRNVDWNAQTLRNQNNNGTVSVSIDPFFFKSIELAPALDFYVRDWTDSAVSGDSGLEPSTHSVFYATSDVWNRRGTLDGTPFVNDQPANEDAGNGPGTIGDNWAFARIRRNVAQNADTVTAHFLVSKFGTGSNYVDSSSMDPDVSLPGPDPTVSFAANEKGPKISAAYYWHLNPVSSTHLCMAVQISTPSDPFVAPSLKGFAPGWPSTDVKVLLDNNKAQRNLGLSTTPARGLGQWAEYHAIAHNAATLPRDMTLRYAVAPEVLGRLAGGTIGVIGDRSVPLTTQGTITIPRVQPGENRWVKVTLPAASGREGEVLTVDFQELVQGQMVDGFSIGTRLGSTADAATAALVAHRSQHTRLGAGFRLADAQAEADAADALLRSTSITGEQYTAFLRKHLPAMAAVLAEMKELLAGDPFDCQTSFDSLSRLASGGADADTLTVAHSTYLNRLDSLLTLRQLEQGDTADILQTVRWAQDLYLRVPRLAGLSSAGRIVDGSRDFVAQYEEGRLGNADYPKHLEGLFTAFQSTAADLERELPALGDAERTLETAVGSGDLTAMEKAHHDFLLQLQSLETTAP